MSDGHIIQQDVVLLSTLLQKLRNTLRNLLSLCEQLLSVVLSNHGLHDFVTQRGEDTLSVISTHFSVDLCKMVHIRMGQHSKRNTHRLQILRTCLRRDLTGGGTNIINERVLRINTNAHRDLNERDSEVGSLTDGLRQDSTNTVEDYRTFASVH